MDPIGAITAITAGVMRRIADSIDGHVDQPQQVVHYHFHLTEPGQADNLDKPEGKGRSFTLFSKR
ncbi:hypothetical protein 7S2_2 [uncultured Caudovirales phage]|uniref:Uncharacterized protein n=1 Tax=uncultured Caudovirales phage TaxID=2100421 RepID=A0A2H4J9S4_9CAUD|nr:hypothetical protein 7S2_2 [uncultured Caudovirales phage]